MRIDMIRGKIHATACTYAEETFSSFGALVECIRIPLCGVTEPTRYAWYILVLPTGEYDCLLYHEGKDVSLLLPKTSFDTLLVGLIEASLPFMER